MLFECGCRATTRHHHNYRDIGRSLRDLFPMDIGHVDYSGQAIWQGMIFMILIYGRFSDWKVKRCVRETIKNLTRVHFVLPVLPRQQPWCVSPPVCIFIAPIRFVCSLGESHPLCPNPTKPAPNLPAPAPTCRFLPFLFSLRTPTTAPGPVFHHACLSACCVGSVRLCCPFCVCLVA